VLDPHGVAAVALPQLSVLQAVEEEAVGSAVVSSEGERDTVARGLEVGERARS
jgi:hypothetical protein